MLSIFQLKDPLHEFFHRVTATLWKIWYQQLSAIDGKANKKAALPKQDC